MAARPGRVDQQRSEALHPPEQRDVINLDPALSQQLLEVPVRQPEPQIPAHRQHNHLGPEPEPSKRRRPHLERRAGPATLHPDGLAGPDSTGQRNSARRGHYELGLEAPSMLRVAAAFDELLATV